MTTDIPCFPAPSAAVVAEARSGRKLAAAHAWRTKEARTTLRDGREVVPTMRVAYDMAKAIAKGMADVAVVVAEGSYELAPSLEEIASREAAERLKFERFHHFMEVDNPPTHTLGVCDDCGILSHMKNFYAPDGMGYPTLVLQRCDGDGCSQRKNENSL